MTSDKSEKEQEATPAALDLGLSALVSEPKLEEHSAPPKAQAPSAPSEPAPEAEPKPDTPKSRFEILADEAKWKELSAACEEHKADSEISPLQAKLWWIKAQLKMDSMPASILAAPLDTATKEIAESDQQKLGGSESFERTRAFASELLIDVASRLTSSIDRGFGIAMLERAYRLSGCGAAELSKLIDLELESLGAKFERSGEMQVESEISRLKSLKAELPQASPKPFELGDQSRQFETLAPPARPTRSNIRVVASLLLLLTLAISTYFFYLARPGHVLLAERVQPNFMDAAKDGELSAPVLEPVQGLGGLDAVFYELGKKGKELINTDSILPRTEKPDPLAPQQKELAPSGKEVIDTSYPVRPKDLGSKPQEVSPSSRQPPDFSRQSSQRRSRYDDEPAPVEVEHFGDSREFLVEADTDVRSKPSFAAVPVDHIYEGDIVRAEAKVGAWLMLRSRQGRVGYVSMDYVRAAAGSAKR